MTPMAVRITLGSKRGIWKSEERTNIFKRQGNGLLAMSFQEVLNYVWPKAYESREGTCRVRAPKRERNSNGDGGNTGDIHDSRESGPEVRDTSLRRGC